MPTYQYACTECDHAFEQFQSFNDDALTVCPRCQGRLRKIFNAVGVVFKGSGFYRNDSRTDGKSATAGGTSTVKADSGSSGDSGSSSSSGDSGSSGTTTEKKSQPKVDSGSASSPSSGSTSAA